LLRTKRSTPSDRLAPRYFYYAVEAISKGSTYPTLDQFIEGAFSALFM
jgi:hypothetical protein